MFFTNNNILNSNLRNYIKHDLICLFLFGILNLFIAHKPCIILVRCNGVLSGWTGSFTLSANNLSIEVVFSTHQCNLRNISLKLEPMSITVSFYMMFKYIRFKYKPYYKLSLDFCEVAWYFVRESMMLKMRNIICVHVSKYLLLSFRIT